MNPQLINCHDNTKVACRGPTPNKIEWIYKIKVRGQCSLEFALEMMKERLTNGTFYKGKNSWFKHI